MEIIESILLAASLCADCFAVSLCSGTLLKERKARRMAMIALAFAIIQTALLFAGWAMGSFIYKYVFRFARWLAFGLLLYVGGGMLFGGIKGDEDSRDLGSLGGIVLAGVATSIDAMAVGAASSLDGISLAGMAAPLASVFVVTFLSVVAGLYGGNVLGSRFGRWARIAGGLVLVGIGAGVLIP